LSASSRCGRLAAPDLDPDAFLSVHPGAAAYYNGTTERFMDKYGDAIYLTPMVLAALHRYSPRLAISRVRSGETSDDAGRAVWFAETDTRNR